MSAPRGLRPGSAWSPAGARCSFGLSSAARPGAPAAHGALGWDLTRLVNAHCLRVSSINSAEWRGRRGLLTPLGSPLPHRRRLGPRPAPRQGTEGTPRTPLSRRLADGPGRSRAPLRAAGTCYFHFYFFCCKKLSCFLWSNAWERPRVVKRTASGCGERPRHKPDARGCRGPLEGLGLRRLRSCWRGSRSQSSWPGPAWGRSPAPPRGQGGLHGPEFPHSPRGGRGGAPVRPGGKAATALGVRH